MSARNSPLRYGTVAMALHWLIAVLILTNVALAIWFNEVMGTYEAGRFTVIQWHKSIGLTVLVLSLGRLAWRLVNPVPPLPADMSPRLRALAHLSHYALYALMILVPLLGWLLVSASRIPIPTHYFGLFYWPDIGPVANLPRDRKIVQGDIYSGAHVTLGYVMMALVAAHAAAALWHHFARRDVVLKRMIPGTGMESA